MQNKTTEKIILKAAKKVFIEKGFDGARMQEIADLAGINKALLHYYFRSKEKMFDAVFEEACFLFFPKISEIMNSELSLFEKIRTFVDVYISVIVKNPHLPIFVLHELSRNSEKIADKIKSFGINPESLIKNIQEEMKLGEIIPIDPKQLIVNMLSLCIFPFVGKPIFQNLIFENDAKAYNKFIIDRKKEVADFIINSISNKKYGL